jgi:uncharacterized small protein (DUF1192 family)
VLQAEKKAFDPVPIDTLSALSLEQIEQRVATLPVHLAVLHAHAAPGRS